MYEWWCVNFRDLWYIIISIYFNEGDMVDILELMHKRHSVRKYIDEDIDSSVKRIIEEKVDEVNRESNLNIKAVFDDKEGFNSKLAKYGKFENVNNFLIMKGVGNDLSEVCGYYGEKLVMELMNLGLGSCWVALNERGVLMLKLERLVSFTLLPSALGFCSGFFSGFFSGLYSPVSFWN